VDGEQVQTNEIAADRKRNQTAPALQRLRRCSERWRPRESLVDDESCARPLKDSGIGTPATRAAIIERLITVGYVERDAAPLVATEKGLNVIRLLNEHALTSPELTGSWRTSST